MILALASAQTTAAGRRARPRGECFGGENLRLIHDSGRGEIADEGAEVVDGGVREMGDDGLRALVRGLRRGAAQLVEEEVARDVKEKRSERGAALVAGGGPVEAHEDLEGEVLGFGQGAERAVEKREERLLPFVEELLPRALVAGGTAGEAVGVCVGDFGGGRGIGRGRRAEDAEQPIGGSGKWADDVHRWEKPRGRTDITGGAKNSGAAVRRRWQNFREAWAAAICGAKQDTPGGRTLKGLGG